VLAKHSKNLSLQDSLAIDVDRMQRNFEPMRRQAEQWRAQQLSTATAKLIIDRAFIEENLNAPKQLAGVFANGATAPTSKMASPSRRKPTSSFHFSQTTQFP
jgi:hypothetical protein